MPKALYNYNRMNESSALHNFSSDHYDKERKVNLDLIDFFLTKNMQDLCAGDY